MTDKNKLIKFYFNYTVKVDLDRAVYLIGSDNELGNWNVLKANRLDCYNEEIWIKEMTLPSKVYKYKYFISNKNSVDQNSISWLDEKERTFTSDELKCSSIEELRKDIKLMSFNLRYQNSIDGIHIWDNRKEVVIQIIMNNCADFVGFQEGRLKQVEYIQESLPAFYKYIGHPRSEKEDDEQCGILYDSNKYVVRDFGTFWLSDTPNIPGSITFENTLPRIVTWVKAYKFSNLVQNIDRAYFFFNTHFDHISEDSRIKCADFFVKQIDNLISKSSEMQKVLLISGDFNAEDDEETIITLKQNGFVSTSDEKGNQEKTFHEFSGKADWKIDHIFYKLINCEKTKACEDYCVIKDKSSKGIFPSDHFPICARLLC
jgi:endonuclease/exonuclease/phosphatase family metal-dependent hydrolase